MLEAFSEQDFASLKEAQAWLDRAQREYNETGQDDIGGLSPDQMARVLACEWGAGDVGQVAGDLELAEVEGSAWWQGARALLRELATRGPLVLTGDAERDEEVWRPYDEAMVEAVGDRGTLGMPLVAGEMPDEILIEEIIAILVAAGLVISRERSMRATPRGSALITDAAAGELHRLLVTTWLRDIDLIALYQGPESFRGLEDLLTFTVCRLLAETTKWRKASWLAQHTIHPDIFGVSPVRVPPSPRLGPVLCVMVLQPMVQLGLLEGRAAAKARVPEFRATPLFARAISFDWTRGGGKQRRRRR